MKKLAIITTHPIQYNAPFFKLLTERKQIEIKVFYTWSQSADGKKFDPGFGKSVQWDIPLMHGYAYTFVENNSTDPGSHHYKGISNPSLVREIQVWGANAILVYGWNFKSHWKVIRFFYKKLPVFFRGDSTLLDQKKGIKQLLRKVVLKYIYSYINIAFYAGVANKAYFEAMGLKKSQLVFMPHAVDNDRFAANDINIARGSSLRQALNIGENATVFLFAGKLEEKKQPEFLVERFISLKNKKAYLIITGSGKLEKHLKDFFSDHPFVKFIGFKNQFEMPAVYNSCDVFILPSKGPNETWGLAINEAMAAGKAIIASDKCGASYDLIEQNKNGFVFKNDSMSELISALAFFADDKISAKSMGLLSLEKIKKYSFKMDCEAIENTLFTIGRTKE